MFDHILLPIALDHNPHETDAMAVAQRLLGDGGKITVLNVAETVPAYVVSQIPDAVLAGNVRESKAMVQELAAAHPHCKGVVISGHAANSILDYAAEHGADCIVIASHKPGMADYLIGSTAARVVRHAQCNVHVVR